MLRVGSSLTIVLISVDFILNPLESPQNILLMDVVTQMELFGGKIAYSSSIMETNRSTGMRMEPETPSAASVASCSAHEEHKTCWER